MSSKSTTREHLQFIQAVDVVPYVVMGGNILLLCCCYGWCCTGVVVPVGNAVLLYGWCYAVVWGCVLLLL